jgi:hypothetical protein
MMSVAVVFSIEGFVANLAKMILLVPVRMFVALSMFFPPENIFTLRPVDKESTLQFGGFLKDLQVHAEKIGNPASL